MQFRFSRPLWALVVLLSLLQSGAWAATKTWIGNAHDVKQIQTITVGGTWLSTETATMTINGKDIVVTLVGDEATTAVATALKNAWMSSTRLDGTGTSDATSNAGGQEFGEFSEVTASVSGSVVTLIANTAGKPFVITVGETSTSGTLTLATPQACTGRYFWDNADNWDTGTVPANDDIVVFRDSNVHCRYGLPNGSLEVTIQQHMSHAGEIGLPAINVDNPAKPYSEYRQRYVRLDDAGTGTNIAHRFGIGATGNGSPLINLKHSTVKCSPVVYNTGTPLATRVGTKALNHCCTANTSTLNILRGSVDYSTQDGSTTAFVTVNQSGGDSRAYNGIHTAGATLTVSAGTATVGGTGAIATINARGGALRLEDQTGAITTLDVLSGATCTYPSTAAIAILRVMGGTFDSSDSPGYTVTDGSVWPGGRFLDPNKRMTIGSTFSVLFNPSPDLQFGTSMTDSMQVTP